MSVYERVDAIERQIREVFDLGGHGERVELAQRLEETIMQCSYSCVGYWAVGRRIEKERQVMANRD